MRLSISAGVLFIGACMIASASYAATPEEDEAKVRASVKANLGKATITLLDALRTATTKIPGGQPVECGFEVEGEKLSFYVEVIANKKHQDVLIDAKTGTVIAVEDTEGEEAEEKKIEEASTRAKLTMRQAMNIAQKQVPRGKPFEAIADMDGPTLVYLVSVLSSDKFVAVLIDANSGKVLGMEESK